jgi:hypothetical protein
MRAVDLLRARPVVQCDPTTCGSAVALAVRLLTDPGYADAVRAADDLSPEQRRIHEATNRAWPRSLGTSPWGLTVELNRHTAGRYRWRWGRPRDPRTVTAALDAGWPVPLLAGRRLPRHYLLVVDHLGPEFVVYDPAHGGLREITGATLTAGAPLGWPRLFGHAVPTLTAT